MKKFCLLMGLVMLAGLVRPVQAGAESAVRVIVSVAAPVFVKPDNKITPLRVAKEGSVLILEADEGDWYRVAFDDPQFGRRVGYIEKRHVRVQVADPQQAVDLTVAESRGVRKPQPRPRRVKTVGHSIGRNFGHSRGGGGAHHAAGRRDDGRRHASHDLRDESGGRLPRLPFGGALEEIRAAHHRHQGGGRRLRAHVVGRPDSTAVGGLEVRACMFASCGGLEESGTTSVQRLTRRR